MGQDANEIRREIEATRARMGDTVEALSYKADVPSRVKDAVQERVDTVKGTINDVVGGVVDSVTGTTHRVGEKLPDGHELRAAARRGVGIAEENPLGLALAALAIGVLAGLLLPVSEIEREKVGPLRDELLERAQSAGSDVIEHGKAVIAETAQSAMRTAQQSAAQHAQQAAAETSRAAETTRMGANDFGGPP